MFNMLYNFWTLNVELVFAIFIKNLRISVKKYPYFISLNVYNIPGKVSGYCAVPFFLIQNLLSVPIERKKKKKIWAEI